MMKIEFVQEIVEERGAPRIHGCFSGWETVVFEIEDDPAHVEGLGSVLSTAAIAP